MASDIERSFICRVIDENCLREVMDARIDENFFLDDEHRMVWVWLLEHWARHSRVPSEQALKHNFPSWRLVEVPEPLSYYIAQLYERRTYTIAQSALLEASDALQNNDLDGVLAAFSGAVRERQDLLTAQGAATIVLTTTLAERTEDVYDELARNPGRLRGMGTGFRSIDRATRGIQPEQYIVIAGPQKAGKSIIQLSAAIHMNEHENARVLLVGFEMSAMEQCARHDAFRAGVSYNRLMDGRMTPRDKRRLRQLDADLRECEDFVLATDPGATTTVSGVRAQIEQTSPHVVCIDGVYLMEDERGERAGSPQALTNISRDLKRLAQSTKVPIIVTTQALESKMSRTTGVTAFSIGYSSAFGQDCDVLLGIESIHGRKGMSKLKVVLSRSGPLAQSDIEIKWDTGEIIEHEAAEDENDETATRRSDPNY